MLAPQKYPKGCGAIYNASNCFATMIYSARLCPRGVYAYRINGRSPGETLFRPAADSGLEPDRCSSFGMLTGSQRAQAELLSKRTTLLREKSIPRGVDRIHQCHQDRSCLRRRALPTSGE